MTEIIQKAIIKTVGSGKYSNAILYDLLHCLNKISILGFFTQEAIDMCAMYITETEERQSTLLDLFCETHINIRMLDKDNIVKLDKFLEINTMFINNLDSSFNTGIKEQYTSVSKAGIVHLMCFAYLLNTNTVIETLTIRAEEERNNDE